MSMLLTTFADILPSCKQAYPFFLSSAIETGQGVGVADAFFAWLGRVGAHADEDDPE